jgi:hypothetical protein
MAGRLAGGGFDKVRGDVNGCDFGFSGEIFVV